MPSRQVQATRWLCLLLVYSGLVFLAAVAPPFGFTIRSGGMPVKLHHIVAFILHTILVSLYLQERPGPVGQRPLLAMGISLLFGGLIELTQHFLPHRSGEVADLLQDAVGIGMGQGGFYLLRRRARDNAKYRRPT